MTTGAFWSCSSGDGSPISPPGVLEPPDASPQDTGTDTRVEPKKLTVVALAPANGDTNVSVQDPIQVTFSEPVNIGPASVTLATPDGTIISTKVALSADQRTITVSPVPAQKAPAELIAHFGDISTLDGQPLATSPEWSWKLPAWLRVGSDLKRFSLGDSSLVVGPGRRIALATREWPDNGSPIGVVSTVDTLHGTWTQLGDPLALVSWEPHMVLDPQGHLVVTASHNRDTLVQRWSGMGWDKLGGPVPDVDDVGNFPFTIDARGKLLLACSEKIQGETVTYDLIVRSFDDKGTWSPVGRPVNDVPSLYRFDPYIAMDPTGVPYVSYTDPWAKIRKWTGSAWVPVGSKLAPTGGYAQRLRIAFDDGGRLFAIGRFSDETTRVMRFDGADWIPVGDAVGPKLGNAPTIVAGHDGHLFAIVYDDEFFRSFRVADITQAGWTKFEWPIEDFGAALAVDPDNVPIVVAPQFGVLRLNR